MQQATFCYSSGFFRTELRFFYPGIGVLTGQDSSVNAVWCFVLAVILPPLTLMGMDDRTGK